MITRIILNIILAVSLLGYALKVIKENVWVENPKDNEI